MATRDEINRALLGLGAETSKFGQLIHQAKLQDAADLREQDLHPYAVQNARATARTAADRADIADRENKQSASLFDANQQFMDAKLGDADLPVDAPADWRTPQRVSDLTAQLGLINRQRAKEGQAAYTPKQFAEMTWGAEKSSRTGQQGAELKNQGLELQNKGTAQEIDQKGKAFPGQLRLTSAQAGNLEAEAEKNRALAAGRSLGGKIITGKEAVDLSEIQTGLQQIDSMVKSFEDLGIHGGPLDKVRSLNPLDTKGKAFTQLQAATKQMIGKALEGGVLRKEDEAKYDNIIPVLGDTPEVLRQKATQLYSLMASRYNNQIEALSQAGYNTSNFKPAEIKKFEAPVPGDKKALAQQALNDPEASEADKAQARKILGL